MKKLIGALLFIQLSFTAVFMQLLFTPISVAEQKSYGDFRNVKYVRNYDGDTITFNIRQAHAIIGDKINIRVVGIDTPEIRGKCAKEKNLAAEAKVFVWRQLVTAQNIDLLDIKRGKYFRIVADVEVEKESLAKKLIDKGLAVEYNGGTKTKDWCD